MSAHAKSDKKLTDGLARNTFFNAAGLVWAILLSFVATPYIIRGLTTEGYGVFSIAMLIAGYAGALSGPMATGSVRFMAQAYGKQMYQEFKVAAFAGVILSTGLALVASAVIVLFSPRLPGWFKVSEGLQPDAIMAFQLAAVGFVLSSLAAALQGIPTAMRRYDMFNVVKVIVATTRILAILLALYLGTGLVGAVIGQLISNVLAIILFAALARQTIYSAWDEQDTSPQNTIGNQTLLQMVREVFSFSATLLSHRMLAMFAQQIDRMVAGTMLGASTLTFYSVPLQVSDRFPMLMSALTTALYPLSSEAEGRGDSAETLRQLYYQVTRLLNWLSAWLAALIIASAYSLLYLWIDAEFADTSWQILILLTIAFASRAPSTVAYQVYTGFGRADVGVRLIIINLVCLAIVVPPLTWLWGLLGTAIALVLVEVPCILLNDIWTQYRLLHQRNWSQMLSVYWKPWGTTVILLLGGMLLPDMNHWVHIISRSAYLTLGFAASVFLLDRQIFSTLRQQLLKLL